MDPQNEYVLLSREQIISNKTANLEKIKKLLLIKGVKVKYEGDINYQDPEGNSVLHYALKFNQSYLICKCLIELGADVNLPNQQEYTPFLYFILHYKSKGRDWRTEIDALFKTFIGHGADINYKLEFPRGSGIHDNTLLHSAIYSLTNNYVPYFNHSPEPPQVILKFENLLFLKQIDVNVQNSLGETPLAVAAKTGYYVPIVYVDGKPVNIQEISTHKKIIKLLIQSGAKLDISDNVGNTPLYLAFCNPQLAHINNSNVYNGYWRWHGSGGLVIPKLLIKYGANPNLSHKHSLIQFVQSTHPKLVEELKQFIEKNSRVVPLSRRIAAILQKTTQSKTSHQLNLSKKFFSLTKITFGEIFSLMEALQKNTTITSLDLRGNSEVNERCAQAIAELLSSNMTLKQILLDEHLPILPTTLQLIEERLNRNKLHALVGRIACLLLQYAHVILHTPEEISFLKLLPTELKAYVLGFLDDKGLLTTEQVNNVTIYAEDKETLKNSRETFLKEANCQYAVFEQASSLTFFGRNKKYLLADTPEIIDRAKNLPRLKIIK